MKLAMLQMAMDIDMDKNFEKTLQMIEGGKEADIIFFPEIQLSPFFPQYEKLDSPYDAAEYLIKKDSRYINEICQAAKDYHTFVSPNVYLGDEDKCYDASLWITPEGKINGISTMVHIFQAEKFYEHDYYTPSEDGFHVYDTPFGKIGIVICFDRHLPESIRTCALKGAELIIVPTANLKSEPLEMFEWEMRIQAMQNNVFIAMCNRVGIEGDEEFAGESLVIDPDGNVLEKADDKEQLIFADIDLKQARTSRNKRAYISARRPELYDI